MKGTATLESADLIAQLTGAQGLGAAELHAWLGSYARLDSQYEALVSILSDDELQRAARFRRAAEQRRYILRRGRLRELLGAYCGVAPQDLTFSYGACGKPELDGLAFPEIRFSVSHTSEIVAYLFGSGHEVGIDVESLQPLDDISLDPAGFLSPAERRQLETSPPDIRPRLFLTYWTRKEACLKALGTGFFLEPTHLDVSTRPWLRVAESARPPLEVRPATLFISDFRVGQRYVGAIASETTVAPTIVQHEFPD